MGAYSNKYGTYVQEALFCRVFQAIEGKGEKITVIRKLQFMNTQVVNSATQNPVANARYKESTCNLRVDLMTEFSLIF